MILSKWTDGKAATAARLIASFVTARFGVRTRWSWRELGRSQADAARVLSWAANLETRQVALDDRASRDAFGLLFLIVSAELARAHEGANGTGLWELVKAGFPRASDALFVHPPNPNSRVKEALDGAVDRYFARHALHLELGKHRWWRTVHLHAGWSGRDWFETVPGWLAGEPDSTLVEALTNAFDPCTFSPTFTRLVGTLRAAHRHKSVMEQELIGIAESPWVGLPTHELRVVFALAKSAPARRSVEPLLVEEQDATPFLLRRMPATPADAELIATPAHWADFDTLEPINIVVEGELKRRLVRPADGWGAIPGLTLTVALPRDASGVSVALRARSGATQWQGFVNVEEPQPPEAVKPPPVTSEGTSRAFFELGFAAVRLLGVQDGPIVLNGASFAAGHAGILARAGWRWPSRDGEVVPEGAALLGQTPLVISRPRQAPRDLGSALGQPITLVRRGYCRSTLIDFLRHEPPAHLPLIAGVTATDRITGFTHRAGQLELGFDGPLEPSTDHAVSVLLRDGRVVGPLPVTEPKPGLLRVTVDGVAVVVMLTYRGTRQDAAFAPGWWHALATADVGVTAALLAHARAPIETLQADSAISAFYDRDRGAVIRAWTQVSSPAWRAAATRRFWLDGVPSAFDVRSATDGTELAEIIANMDIWHPLWAVRHAAAIAADGASIADHIRTRFHLRRADDAVRLWEDLASELQFNLALVRSTLTPLVKTLAKGEPVAGRDRPLLVSAMNTSLFVSLASLAMWATLRPEFSPV